jgi:hypothetical protein
MKSLVTYHWIGCQVYAYLPNVAIYLTLVYLAGTTPLSTRGSVICLN